MYKSSCDATMSTDRHAAIRLIAKSSLQRICEMLEYRFRNLCATSTNQCIATAWIVRSQLSLACLVKNVD